MIDFKKYFDSTEPELIKAGNTNVRLGIYQVPPKVDCRLISEDLYQKMVIAIEEPLISNLTAQAIIDITKENFEIKRGLGDLILFIHEARSGKRHTSLKNSNIEIGHIFKMMNNNFKLIRDNFKL